MMNKIDEFGTSNLENPMAPEDINDETMIHEMGKRIRLISTRHVNLFNFFFSTA